ncbi:transglycosylase family protein [Streptomyces sp. TRM68367]|uniref:LysM peptidoglycan-binding domain-containing protein n=1 Tax=Streptomyces sp. TRM68367 TaxID=2758415 RepID=UPI00165A942E|nr:transglycosylase family protein [Streptomyces sp. TRM68367]MBC9729876.1 transglycosylase family protein [Streptomyces sp. TRM68367]
MLSGNGRHRRPRQAPALFVAAGVTGSAVAIPLLGATSASAADGTAWDRVAACETSGAWSENSGNGYYGGLQLTQEDWEKYGGLEYAPSADQASRNQQIYVAEKILAKEGPAAWPVCGLTAGLTEGSGSVDVDTGVQQDQSSGTSGSGTSESGTSDTSGNSDTSTSAGSSGESPSPAATPPSDAASPDSSDLSDSSVSDGPSSTADELAKSDTSPESGSESEPTPSAPQDPQSDMSGQGVGSSSLTDTGAVGTGRHRGPSADESPAADGSYTVRPGDTLWSIADSLGLQGGWRELYAENKQVIGADPNVIIPGQQLHVGAETGEK